MSEGQSRNLRPRKTSHLIDSDDQQKNGYVQQHCYNTHYKEMRLTEGQMSSMSKLLSKFLNDINLKYSQTQKLTRRIKKNKKIDSQNINKNVKSQQNLKSNCFNLKHNKQRDHEARKQNPLYSYKNSNLSKGQSKSIYSTNHQNQNQQFANSLTGPLMHQISQLKDFCPGIMEYINMPQEKFNGMTPFSKNLISSTGSFKKNIKNQTNTIKKQVNEVKQLKQGKVFKRASYHIAIAYHIYIKQMRQKKQQNGKIDIDPTYYAKRLKEEKSKQMQNQN